MLRKTKNQTAFSKLVENWSKTVQQAVVRSSIDATTGVGLAGAACWALDCRQAKTVCQHLFHPTVEHRDSF